MTAPLTPISFKAVLAAIRFVRRCGFKSYDFYADALHALVEELFRGDISEDAFVSMGNQLVEDQISDAWFEGLAVNGMDIENMTDDWWTHLNGIIASEQDFLSGFAADISSASGDPNMLDGLLARADLYAQRWTDIYNQAILYSAEMGETFVWVLGNTEEHCESCEALDGWVATAQEWIESGVNPQMPPNDVLECGGWRCDCRLEQTDAPSMGDPRDAL